MSTERSGTRAGGPELSEAAKRLIYQDRSGNAYSPAQVELVVAICRAYDLAPELKHVQLIQGACYITNAGLLHVAHSSGDLDGIETRPATKEERAAFLLGGDDGKTHVWRCFVHRRGHMHAYEGWGKVGQGERGAAGTHPQEMAATRAVNRALRLAYNVGMISTEEMSEDALTPRREDRQDAGKPPARQIDAETGEIADTAARSSTPPAARQPAPTPADVRPLGEYGGPRCAAAVRVALTQQGFSAEEAQDWITARLVELDRDFTRLTVAEGQALVARANAAAAEAEEAAAAGALEGSN